MKKRTLAFRNENPQFKFQLHSHVLYFLPFLSAQSGWNLIVFSRNDPFLGYQQYKTKNVLFLHFYNEFDVLESFSDVQRIYMR